MEEIDPQYLLRKFYTAVLLYKYKKKYWSIVKRIREKQTIVKIKRFLPIGILLLSGIIIYFTGVTNYLSFTKLQDQQEQLTTMVKNNPIIAAVFYIGIYTLFTACCLPGSGFLTVVGGFLFPQPLSTIYVVIAATTGACILFLAARYASQKMRKQFSFAAKIESGLKKHPFCFLFFLRLVPLFPFFVVNIGTAVFGVGFFPFFVTTFLGIIPLVVVYTQLGNHLGRILTENRPFSLDNVLEIRLQIVLLFLALFSLLPIIIKRIQKK